MTQTASFLQKDPDLPKRLHELYCKLSGFNLPWGVQRIYAWELFCLRFTEDDLRVVIKWIKGRQVLNKPARSLTFRSLISGPASLDYFEEDLCQARSELRGYRDKGRAAVLEATGRVEETKPARSTADILKGVEEFERFKSLKENL